MKDVFSQIKLARAISPVVVTDNTATASQVLDCAGFTGATVVYCTGTVADADTTITALLQECDTSGGTYTDVADADMIGTESGGSFDFSDDNKVYKLAYKGNKRYLKFTLTPANNTGNLPIAAIWILENPRSLPQTTQEI